MKRALLIAILLGIAFVLLGGTRFQRAVRVNTASVSSGGDTTLTLTLPADRGDAKLMTLYVHISQETGSTHSATLEYRPTYSNTDTLANAVYANLIIYRCGSSDQDFKDYDFDDAPYLCYANMHGHPYRYLQLRISNGGDGTISVRIEQDWD